MEQQKRCLELENRREKKLIIDRCLKTVRENFNIAKKEKNDQIFEERVTLRDVKKQRVVDQKEIFQLKKLKLSQEYKARMLIHERKKYDTLMDGVRMKEGIKRRKVEVDTIRRESNHRLNLLRRTEKELGD